MEGKGGVRAWRWLFYIEGALTMFFALVLAASKSLIRRQHSSSFD